MDIEIFIQHDSDGLIRVISTYKADDSMIKAVKHCEESLKLTQSFRNQQGPLFNYVNKLKQQALGIKRGGSFKMQCTRLQNLSDVDIEPKRNSGRKSGQIIQGILQKLQRMLLSDL